MKKMVTLNPGESKLVTFAYTPTVAKNYQVSVDGLSGSFSAIPLAGEIFRTLIWYEPLAKWEDVVSGREIPLNGAIYIGPVGVNRSEVNIILHMDLEVTYPDGTKHTLTATENQDRKWAPGGGAIVIFEPFLSSQGGTYTLEATLSSAGQILDSVTFTLITVAPVVEIETLRPNGVGSLTELHPFRPGTGEQNYENVDDVYPDYEISYVGYHNSDGPLDSNRKDLYRFPYLGIDKGTINKVTIYFLCCGRAYFGKSKIYASSYIMTNGVEIGGDYKRLPFSGWPPEGSWVMHSQEYINNPQSGNPWTWDEINALEAGVRLRLDNYEDGFCDADCTQVYVEVNYIPVS